MANIEKPRTLDELDALYDSLKSELAPAGRAPSDEVVEQQHGKCFEDEVLTTTTLVIPIWYHGEELGTFSLHGDRILGTRTGGKAKFDAVRQKYAHVLAPKAKQTLEECRRGNQDAEQALSELVAVLTTMISRARYYVSFDKLPKGDDTLAERTLSILFSAVGVFSKTKEATLRQVYAVQVRPKDAIFTAREMCRVLSEVMRNELVFRMPTMAAEIAYLESAEYVADRQASRPPAPPYVISGYYLDKLGREVLSEFNQLLLVPAAS